MLPAFAPCSPAYCDTFTIALNNTPSTPTTIVPFTISSASSFPASLITPTIITKANDILSNIDPAFLPFAPACSETLTITAKNVPSNPITVSPFAIPDASSPSICLITLTITSNATDIAIIVFPEPAISTGPLEKLLSANATVVNKASMPVIQSKFVFI